MHNSPIPASSTNRFPINIPNTLTFLRILAIPGVIALTYGHREKWHDLWAAILFGTAFWTDFFDGMIARKTQTITRLGRVMDPLADKLIVLAATIMLVYLHRVDAIIAILLLSREVAVSGLRSLAGAEGIMIPSILTGKIKVFAEGFAIAFLLLGPNYSFADIEIMKVGNYLLYVALGLAIWSAAVYFRDYFRGGTLTTP